MGYNLKFLDLHKRYKEFGKSLKVRVDMEKHFKIWHATPAF